MSKWLECEPNLNVKNNFGINLPSELKLIAGLARRFRIDFKKKNKIGDDKNG